MREYVQRKSVIFTQLMIDCMTYLENVIFPNVKKSVEGTITRWLLGQNFKQVMINNSFPSTSIS